jgi:hypothetical protein
VGDAIQYFKAVQKLRQELKAILGVDCPGCRKKEPKRIPSRLLPGHRCRVCGYVDPRPPGSLE